VSSNRDYLENIIRKLRKHLRLEVRSIEMYGSALKRIKSPVLREVLEGILIDSLAHRELLKASINVLKEVSRTDFKVEAERIGEEEETKELIEVLKEHLRLEENAVKGLIDLAEKVNIYSIRETLRTLYEDERRHHIMLKNIIMALEEQF